MAAHSCSEYDILLDRRDAAYYPGDVVSGRVVITTTSAMQCRGIRVRLQGVAEGKWHTGSGDNRRDYHTKRTYVSLRHTLFGNFYRTVLLEEAGAEAYFDADNGGGEMHIPANFGTFAVGVMDYDWGRRDDLIGECTVNIHDLLAAGGASRSLPLYRKGEAGRGEVTLSALPGPGGSAESPSAVLRCHRATGLASADWFGKNDVYVQAYAVDAGADASAGALPEPARDVHLPAGRFEKPFAFVLPDSADLPSSMDGPVQGGDYCRVRYSLYSNVDIKMRMDPSTRVPITILSRPRLPDPSTFAPTLRAPAAPVEIYECGCCLSGTAQFTATVSHTALAVGDAVYVAAEVVNDTRACSAFRVELVEFINITMRSGRRRQAQRVHSLLAEAVDPYQKKKRVGSPDRPRRLRVPTVSPGFSGDGGHHPLRWFYALRFKLDMPPYMNDLVWTVPVTVSLVPTAACLEQPTFAPLGFVVAVEDPEWPPAGPVYEGELPQGHVVAVCGPQPIVDVQEDEHNVCGVPEDYAPIYPAAPEASPNVFVLPAYDASGGGAPAVAPGSAQMDRGGGSEEETKESPPEERAPKTEAEA